MRFHFLILFFNYDRELESFIFCGIKTHIFEYKKDIQWDIISVPHLDVFGFLVCNSLQIHKSYDNVLLTSKTSPNIVQFQLLKFRHFSISRKRTRSSHRRCSLRKCALRNFTKFTGKHLCQCLFFNKVAGLSLRLIKKETLAQVFSCEIWYFS